MHETARFAGPGTACYRLPMRKLLLLLTFLATISSAGIAAAQFSQMRYLPPEGIRGILGAAQDRKRHGGFGQERGRILGAAMRRGHDQRYGLARRVAQVDGVMHRPDIARPDGCLPRLLGRCRRPGFRTPAMGA